MVENVPAPIIIKRVHAEYEHAHGGAWKIALADMMTAMMAFFLLLWLLSSTSSEDLTAIAEYFRPANKLVGSGGDVTVIEKSSAGTPGSIAVAEADERKKDEVPPEVATVVEDDAEERVRIDDRNFEALEQQIKTLISADPIISSSLDQIAFIRDEDGLRVEIIDRENSPMFAIGTSIHLPRARELLELVASAIRDLSNKIIVRGHTDSRGYKTDDGRNNWTLSSERADSTRLVLEAYGVRHDRFVKIEGYADTMPFVPSDLYDARNRRISIVLKYQSRSK